MCALIVLCGIVAACLADRKHWKRIHMSPSTRTCAHAHSLGLPWSVPAFVTTTRRWSTLVCSTCVLPAGVAMARVRSSPTRAWCAMEKALSLAHGRSTWRSLQVSSTAVHVHVASACPVKKWEGGDFTCCLETILCATGLCLSLTEMLQMFFLFSLSGWVAWSL